MRPDVFLLCFLTLCHYKWCTYGIDISKLEEIIRGVDLSDDESSSIDIDDDHRQNNPECGYLPDEPSSQSASSRISNAKEAKVHYPWVIYVERKNRFLATGFTSCGGSIITQTTAVTASHCICDVPKEHIDTMEDGDKQYVECKGGEIIDFQVLPPNEVTRRNKLSVGIGSKDKSKLHWIDILTAYVMGSKKKHPDKRFYEDVGLLFTKGETGKGDLFYKHTVPKKDIEVGSVCLAASKIKKKIQESYMYAGKVTTVGWGRRYRDVKDSAGNPRQKKHSCATSEFGPIAARLRQCELDDLIKTPNGIPKKPEDWGCNRLGRPAGYDHTKCSKYLKQAETAIARKIGKLDGSKVLETLWSLTNKIVIAKSFPNKKEYICYKEKLFDDNGWCYVYKGTQLGDLENTWGFCDSSCKLMQVTDTKPLIFHRMVWEFPVKQPSRCSERMNDYYLCISSLLPETSVLKFKRNGKDKLKFLGADKEKIEDSFNPENKYLKQDLGFQMPCKGDSGSGHWMYDSDKDQRALVAIGSHNIGEYCGAPSHLLLTTHPNILKWIKRYSDIQNS